MTQNVYKSGGATITPFALQRMLGVAGLRWVMSKAQWSGIVSYWGYGTNETEVMTLFRNFYGLPVEVRDNFPHDVIELWWGAMLISRTEQLAVPVGFSND